MENKIIYGVLGILSLIVATMGGTLYLTESQLENAFICSMNENIALGVTRLSSTSKTVYWIDGSGEEKAKVCRNGLWLDLRQYAKDNNIELNILLQNINDVEVVSDFSNSVEGIKWKCSPDKCVRTG